MPKPKISEICLIEGCGEKAKGFGWCKYHYQRFYKTHPDYKPRLGYNDRRKHPFYILWWQRKKENDLSEEWFDFLKFVEDISPKPEGYYFLVKIKDGPFGPNNFVWRENLKQKDGESNKDWWARKWQARRAANPSAENDRGLKRKFGLTREQYNEILKSQNYVCAICKQKETSICGNSGSIKRLAVDHCHSSLKIRGLLCWRCNGTIGKVEEDLELFDKMKAYIIKHKGDDNG